MEITVEENGCGCIQEVFTEFPTLYDTTCYEKFKDCNKIRSNSQVLQNLQATNPVFLRNTSRTNVYRVLIQKDIEGSVSYESYDLEPTSMFYIGCNRQFNVEIRNKYSVSQDYGYLACEDQVEISGMTNNKVLYQVHNIEKLKEY